jgi:hypothetical protein
MYVKPDELLRQAIELGERKARLPSRILAFAPSSRQRCWGLQRHWRSTLRS